MTQETKFRVWNGSKFIYFSPSTLIIDAYEKSDDLPNDIPELYALIRKNAFKVDRFTGLKDKNGKEIYEGDVVDLTDDNWWDAAGYGGFDSRIQKVEWIESTTGFAPFAVYDSDCGVKQDAKKCEVIGNIYENPELLMREDQQRNI